MRPSVAEVYAPHLAFSFLQFLIRLVHPQSIHVHFSPFRFPFGEAHPHVVLGSLLRLQIFRLFAFRRDPVLTSFRFKIGAIPPKPKSLSSCLTS
jgi:hypothetical protein